MKFVKFKNTNPILVLTNCFLWFFLQFLYIKFQLFKLKIVKISEKNLKSVR